MTITSTNNQASGDTIIQFIRNTFNQANKTTAVIGLSGGIDSATSLCLTAKAIGAKHIHAFYLPTKKSHPIHLTHIQELLTCLEFPASNFHIIPITTIVQKTWRVLKKYEKYKGTESMDSINTSHTSIPSIPQIDRLRLANLTARIRMMTLFDAAKKYDALVMGTENKSERMLGYFTRFGDEASDLEPIAHLFKTEVISLAKHLGIPDSILTKAPTADLWLNQTDAQELGFTYETADPILRQIAAGKTPTGEHADKVIAQVKKAAFKQLVPYHINEKE